MRQPLRPCPQHCSDFLLKLIEEVYRWLPLGTLVNNKVLVVHGGISDSTDLDWVKNLARHKVSEPASIRRPAPGPACSSANNA